MKLAMNLDQKQQSDYKTGIRKLRTRRRRTTHKRRIGQAMIDKKSLRRQHQKQSKPAKSEIKNNFERELSKQNSKNKREHNKKIPTEKRMTLANPSENKSTLKQIVCNLHQSTNSNLECQTILLENQLTGFLITEAATRKTMI